MALFGAGWAVSFDFGVRVYGAEIIAAIGLVVIRWRPVLTGYPMARRVLGAYGLWILAIGISDAVNGTALFDFARNMATPLIGGATLVFALAALSRKPSALLTFLAATTIAKAILGDATYGDVFADEAYSLASIEADTNFFKVRIDPFLTPALLLGSWWLGRRSLMFAAVLLLAASIGYFILDDRAIGLIFFLSALVLAGVRLGFRPRLGHVAFAGLVAMLVGYGAYAAYTSYTLNSNPYGHNGKQMQRMENPYNPFELLLQGRSEWLFIPSAIAERPFFGWGSWAEDTDHRFTYLRLQHTDTAKYFQRSWLTQKAYIPAHSLIGAAWVWSGMLGFAAMLWLLHSIWRMLLKLPKPNTPLLVPVTFFAIATIWHFLFSPPQHVRLTFPIAIASLIVVTKPTKRPNSLAQSAPLASF